MEKLEKLLMSANSALQAIKNYIQENENSFLYMDLKLHNAFYECDSIIKDFPVLMENTENAMNLFYDFCDFEYDSFIEYMQECNIKFSPVYMGRTSQFTLHDRNTIIINCGRYNYNVDFASTIQNLLYYDTYCEIDINDECMIDTDGLRYYLDNGEIETVKTDLQYISSGKFLEYVKKYCEDIIIQYDYIKAVKDNQTESLRDYMQDKNDILQDEIEHEQNINLEIWLDGLQAIFA